MASVLVVEDQDAIRELLMTYLRLEGHQADGERDAEAAFRSFDAKRHDLVISDLMLPGHDGLWLLQQVQGTGADTKVILSTGYDAADVAVTALRQGAFDYVVKPIDSLSFKTKVREALRAQEAERRSRGVEEDAQQRQRNLAALYAITSLVHGALDLAPAVSAGLDRFVEILRLPAVFAWIEEQEGVPESLSSSGLVELRPGTLREHAAGWLLARAGDPDPALMTIDAALLDPVLDWVAAPVQSGGTTFGVVAAGVDSTSAGAASLHEILRSLGRQVGTAVANARDFARERKRSADLDLLHQATLHAFAAPGRDEALRLVLDAAVRQFRAPAGVISTTSGAAVAVHPANWRQRSESVTAHPARAISRWLETWPPGEPYRWVSRAASGDIFEAFAELAGPAGELLALPIPRAPARPLGALLLADVAGEPMDGEDSDIAFAYAQAAATLAASLAADSAVPAGGHRDAGPGVALRQARAAAARYAAAFERILDTERRIVRDVAASVVLEAVDAETAWLVSAAEGHRVISTAHRNTGVPRIAPMPERAITRAITSRAVVRVPEGKHHPAIVTVPILDSGHVVGAVVAAARPGHRVTSQDLKVMRGVGAVAFAGAGARQAYRERASA